MNTKSIILAGALSLGLGSLANAQQYVYLTGSTAARGIVYNAISTGTAVFDAAPSVVTQGGTSASGSTYMNFRGNIGGADTIIKCHWSGSEGGIADLVGGNELFLTDAAASDLSGNAPDATVSSPVDIAMADNSVTFSRNPGAAVTGTKVGVIAFKWVKEKGSAAALQNVSDQTVRVVLAGGAKLALFSGNPADTTFVYATGRDHFSGTRVNALGITGFGIFTIPSQLQVNSDGSMKDQQTLPEPPNAPIYLGDYGYSGGGDVATQMGYDLGQATSIDLVNAGAGHFSVIAYLGTSDAAKAIGNGATELTYNGFSFSAQNVENGQYAYWGNEYIYKKTGASSQAGTVYTKLSGASGIKAYADDSVLFSLTDMKAVRGGPTTDPVHL